MITKLGETRMQIGIDSFAAAYDAASVAVSASDRLRNLVEQIEFADQVGLDVFGIGEHHRREYLDSAPAVILGAAAARTHRIRLTSAVTVLSSADPVRVFQNFATLDLREHPSDDRDTSSRTGCGCLRSDDGGQSTVRYGPGYKKRSRSRRTAQMRHEDRGQYHEGTSGQGSHRCRQDGAKNGDRRLGIESTLLA
jgi:hypothetical protein